MSNGLNCVNGLTQLGDPCPYEDLSLGGSGRQGVTHTMTELENYVAGLRITQGAGAGGPWALLLSSFFLLFLAWEIRKWNRNRNISNRNMKSTSS